MHERLAINQTLNSGGEQPDDGVEVHEENDQIALRRMRSRTGNPLGNLKSTWTITASTAQFWKRIYSGSMKGCASYFTPGRAILFL